MNSKINKAVVYAFNKGYRVREDGVAVNPKGSVIKGSIGSSGYKRFNIMLNGKEQYPVYIHKLCAYQKYGDIAFQADCVRHLDGNPLNNRPDNIEIGTQSDNMMDMPKDVRQKRRNMPHRLCVNITRMKFEIFINKMEILIKKQ